MKKKTKLKIQEPKNYYTCRWCGNEKSEDKFFKCSIQHKSYICTDCIKAKYNDLNGKCEKYLAIFICCSALDIAFYWDIYRSLEIGQGIGIYVRQLNLLQNQNPDTFEDGIIKNNIIDYTPEDMKIDKAKAELRDIISRLEVIRDEI